MLLPVRLHAGTEDVRLRLERPVVVRVLRLEASLSGLRGGTFFVLRTPIAVMDRGVAHARWKPVIDVALVGRALLAASVLVGPLIRLQRLRARRGNALAPAKEGSSGD